MKKLIPLTFILLILLPSVSQACSVCGCGVGSYHYGILPQFRKNFVGIRYRHSSYVSTLDDSHAEAFSYETFQTAELWGRFYPAKKIQAFIFVPFNFNERIEGLGTTTLKGLGDIVVSANYNLINTYDSLDISWKQNLLVGGGLKLPTGEFQALENGLTVNQNFQLGTGSLDFLFNLIYTIRHKNLGLNTELSYSLNTTNKDEYKFGDALRTSLSAFYIFQVNAITLMPNIGISGEFFKDNKQFGEPFPDTGGWASLYNAGAEIYYRNIALGFSYSHPGEQELFSGKVVTNDRISAHLTFMF
ncbi:MAG TPA: hypothetical protein VFG46_06850 [Chryseolinea sp.]|nr:hypothetical protein [Chryseolinea sp.]